MVPYMAAGVVAALAVLAYVAFLVAFRERLALADKIPGPYVFPVIGHLYLLVHAFRGFDALFQETWRRSAEFPTKVAKLMFMHRIAVGVWQPEDVEVILSSTQHMDKSTEYRFFKPWLGNGLLISIGDTWRSHRKLIAPTFHVHVLKQFVHLFHRNSDALCRRLEAVTAETIDVHDLLSEATVEILLETAMGVDRSTQKNGYEYAMAVVKMCGILHRRALRPWLWLESMFRWSSDGRSQQKLLNTIHGLTQEVLRVRRGERQDGVREGLYRRAVGRGEEDAVAAPHADPAADTGISYGQSAGLRDDLDDDIGEKRRVAFLDQMLDSAEDDKMTAKEVEEEVTTIMFEGHDTTASASSFFLCLMGVHRDVQQRCVDELHRIFGDSDRPATFQDTLEMKYLERCIMETLRLFPPVPILARRIRENIKLASGYVIPAETTVVVPPFLLHRDPVNFPNPSQFNPDNFLPERCAGRHYYAFIPFSAGPRSCVGRKYAMLKLKILLSTILRRLEVHAEVPEKDFKLVGDIILKRKEGFPCRFVPRKTAARMGMAG